MAQIEMYQAYDDRLADRVIAFLQTGDRDLFPFSHGFDDERMAAFVQDLREGLAALNDSGSARKTSATGFPVSDDRIHEVVDEWARARGGWPAGSDPRDPDTALLPRRSGR